MKGLRRRRLFVLTTAVLSVLAAWSVAPATASNTHAKGTLASSAAVCTPGAETFGSLSRLTAPSGTARSFDGRKEKNTRGVVADSTIPAGERPQTSVSFTTTIPVWFHVVAASRAPKDGWVSDGQIQDQIAVLNSTFAGERGGADTGFRFSLAGTTRTINAGWFAQQTFAQEVEMKSALKQGDSTTLNIYSTSGGGFLGWAYLPKIVVYQQFQVLDGVVIHFGSMPGGDIANFNLGFTATHEVGHYLGLEHTFEKDCRGQGDYVDDTPAMSVPTSGCPVGKDTCPEPGLDPIHNYMDYSHDACYTEFTAGQAAREQEQWLHWRVEHGY